VERLGMSSHVAPGVSCLWCGTRSPRLRSLCGTRW
jgi:hypothetical protein